MLVTVIISYLFSGCGRFFSDLDEYLESSRSKIGGDMGLEILRCFSEKDTEGLKKMFCGYIKNTHDLDSEIEKAFTVINKPIISHKPIQIGGEEYLDDGVITKSRISTTIDDVTISDKEKYDIFFAAYLVTNKGDNLIGVSVIDIYDDNNKLICSIGEHM